MYNLSIYEILYNVYFLPYNTQPTDFYFLQYLSKLAIFQREMLHLKGYDYVMIHILLQLVEFIGVILTLTFKFKSYNYNDYKFISNIYVYEKERLFI